MNEDKVAENVNKIFEKRKKAVIALCRYYAKLVIQDFKDLQNSNYYWENQSFFARDLMFAKQFVEDDKQVVGFFMAHGVSYGVYLELANDRKYAALKPTIDKFLPQFKEDLKKIYGN